MHFEVLVEDKSASIAIGYMLEKILGPNNTRHSWRVIPYKGLGRIPKGLGKTSANKRILLDRLPMLLRGYGRWPDSSRCSVVVVVDADHRDCVEFKQELLDVLTQCQPRPRTLFRIAIEESEAWLLGDKRAVLAAYPKARRAVLDAYVQDSVCGTWEVLGAAVSSKRERSDLLSWPSPGSPSVAGRKPSRHTWMWMRMRRRVFVRFVMASERWRRTQPDWTCIAAPRRARLRLNAGIAQLVEHNLAKVGVAGSSPVSRSSSLAHLGVRAHPPARGRATSPCRRHCGLHPPPQPG